MTENFEDIPILTETNSTELMPALPPIAGFWRRLAAWLIDVAILGIIGQVIGWSFRSFLFQLGPYGRLLGLPVLLVYLGVQNSRIGGGQTWGKGLLKIAVRDRENQPIGVGKSFLRAGFLVLPAMLNGWVIPVMQNKLIAWLATIIIFGGGSVLLYLMIFNRGTRQGLHDLLCKTYVVHLRGAPVASYPEISRIHLVISGSLIVLATLGSFGLILVSPVITSSPLLNTPNEIYQSLRHDKRFFSVGVKDQRSINNRGGSARILVVEVWHKGELSAPEQKQLMVEISQDVLAIAGDLSEYDAMSVRIIVAFDIAIATGHTSVFQTQSIQNWRRASDVTGFR